MGSAFLEENISNGRDVIFTLTRGYGWLRKYRYRFLIRRNLALKKVLLYGPHVYDQILFHEGNIGAFDQFLIKFFSNDFSIQFVNISEDFRIPPGLIWSGMNPFGVGYSLMCRFNYLHVWKYLKGYGTAIRIDEDCELLQFQNSDIKDILITGAISEETHLPTNESLLPYLESFGLNAFYDHKFPYTNVYATRVEFWLRKDVQDFLKGVASQELSLEDRWGDLPVLGVALKAFGGWKSDQGIDPTISYRHLSHNALVRGGEIFPV